MAKKCSNVAMHRLQRLCAIVGAGTFIASSVLVILECLFTGLILTPIGWMLLVWAVWNLVFGLIILALQFGYLRGCISRNAGFLDTRLGRANFYMYCGCVAGANADSKEANMTTLVISYMSFALLWYVGIFELCASSNRHSTASDTGVPAEVQPGLAPLGASLCGSAATRSDAVTITVTPDDAAAAARLAGQNAGAISAWAAAVNKAGGSGAGASQPGGSASGASSGNPFFRS